ncbi:MAG: SDR family NAD(P)-dependent oxidoreductase [bacterium]|nr:SDR family NAD(P)-dependent oxidoreductase [bacterium]
MQLTDKKIVITGASSGIGKSCAELFAAEGASLLLVARRINRLKEMEMQLLQNGAKEVNSVQLDVRNFEDVIQCYETLPDHWKSIDVLVNNAGLSRGLDKIFEGKIQDWEEMIDTNVKGLLYITRVFLPKMIENGRGDIVNIGSIAGYEVYPAGNVYCATKHAVKALTQGMRMDTLGTGIRVTSIDPGLVETEFSEVRFRGDQERAKKTYQGLTPLHPDDVAHAILFAITRPPHVTINSMIIMPTHQASVAHIFRKS